MLYKQFQIFVKKKKLFSNNDTILLAVSGGMDSMAMLHLFKKMKMTCEVAHCNFQLRGVDSDADEMLVRQTAEEYGFPVFVTHFETEEYATENKISIQMAARDLRYTWFKKLAAAHQISKIAIAHNLDDSLETFFVNLGRGSGINGLAGISVENGTIIRPLLFATRSDIEKYVSENSIVYREDSSNSSDKYLRNNIRHHLLPKVIEIFPNFKVTLSNNLERLNDVQKVYNQSIIDYSSKIIYFKDKNLYISIEKLLATPAPQTILFEIIRKYGFLSSEMEDIFNSIQAISGKYFLSTTHKMVKDRDCFIISQRKENQQERYYIDEDFDSKDCPIQFKVRNFEKNIDFKIERNSRVALLDTDKLEFPLIIRKWQLGDYFVPLGMSGMKKLSDFFIDQKMSITEKENTWLLLSGYQIVWIIGKRLDNRFKITEKSKLVTRIEWID